MRDKIFRGKRVDNGQWVYGYYFITPLTDEATGSNPEDGWFFLTGKQRHCISMNHCVYEVIPETVAQYIGLKDKNDAKIFEDDIVKAKDWDPQIFRIQFIEGGFCTTNKKADMLYPLDINHFYSSVGCGIEVIGNIYDNPELIKI